MVLVNLKTFGCYYPTLIFAARFDTALFFKCAQNTG